MEKVISYRISKSAPFFAYFAFFLFVCLLLLPFSSEKSRSKREIMLIVGQRSSHKDHIYNKKFSRSLLSMAAKTYLCCLCMKVQSPVTKVRLCFLGLRGLFRWCESKAWEKNIYKNKMYCWKRPDQRWLLDIFLITDGRKKAVWLKSQSENNENLPFPWIERKGISRESQNHAINTYAIQI